MKSRIQLFFILILMVSAIYGNIINIPSDYATIQEGIDSAFVGDTVVVENGTYSGVGNINLDYSGKAILVMSENGANSCIIDATGSDGFYFHSGEPNTSIVRGFSIINGWDGIYCEGASPQIEYCIIDSCNYGIMSSINWSTNIGSSPIIRYNLVKNNSYDGIQVYESGSATIVNNTVVNNADYGIRTGFVDADIFNNIVVGNAYGISKDSSDEVSVCADYNDVWNNDSTNYIGFTAGDSSISADPLFVASEDFHLQNGSPCIDAGNPISEKDPDDTRIDIGVYYYHQSAVESIEGNEIPSEFTLFQNYPNPFNPTTNIQYFLPINSNVKLTIYNCAGQVVDVLIDGEQTAGDHIMRWNASHVVSGVYFYRIQADDFTQVKKCILLK